MRGVRSLSSGLFIGLLIAATVFGALVLSVRGQPTSISELPIPTVTLQIDISSPYDSRLRLWFASIQPRRSRPSPRLQQRYARRPFADPALAALQCGTV
jgi:hypothetical protein